MSMENACDDRGSFTENNSSKIVKASWRKINLRERLRISMNPLRVRMGKIFFQVEERTQPELRVSLGLHTKRTRKAVQKLHIHINTMFFIYTATNFKCSRKSMYGKA